MLSISLLNVEFGLLFQQFVVKRKKIFKRKNAFRITLRNDVKNNVAKCKADSSKTCFCKIPTFLKKYITTKSIQSSRLKFKIFFLNVYIFGKCKNKKINFQKVLHYNDP